LPREHSLLDLRVCAAAAEVARHLVPDLVTRRLGVRLDERRCGDDLAGCAKPALKCIGPNERRDERVLAQTLDRGHLPLSDRVDESDAGEDRDAVELHGASSAVALAAGDLRARQAEIETQRLGQRPLDRGLQPVDPAVDAKLDQPTAPGIAEALGTDAL
jgi:hypothetical protein